MARIPSGTTSVAVALSLGHATMFGLQSTYFPELFRHTSALHRYFLRLPGCCSTLAEDYRQLSRRFGCLHGQHGGRVRDADSPGNIAFTATLAARETKDDECPQETIRLLRHARALNDFA